MTQKNSKGLLVNSDWVKTFIVIVAQSVAIAMFLAAMKSDLEHLTEDFKSFRGEIKPVVDQVVQMKSKVDMLGQEADKAGIKAEALDREVRETRDSVQELKLGVKDLTKEIETLKQRERVGK